jgi:regulator of sigma E protease
LREITTPFGKGRVGVIGLAGSNDPNDYRLQTYGVGDSIALAASETWHITERTINFIGGLIVGRESKDQLAGPIGTGYIAGKVAEYGFVALINLAAVLSISIGLINLFPIPLLDGGHLMYYFAEALRGRPLSERVQEYGFRVGLAFVVGLMIFATFNDILNLTRG